MTVTVRLSDGGTNEFLRYGDAYRKHSDGSLDVLRTGAKEAYSYAAGAWSDVEGDEQKVSRLRFWH